MANQCGDCMEWPNTIAGPKRREKEGERACLMGGKLVHKAMPADMLCFTRRVDMSGRQQSRAPSRPNASLRFLLVKEYQMPD
jgi:hypothetical protein